MDYFKDLLPVATAFANDPNLKEWGGWSRESFERVLNSLFDSEDFLNSVILLNRVVNGDLQAPSIPLELENLLIILKNAKEQKQEIRDKAINDVHNYVERLKKTYLPLAEASKQRQVVKKEKTEEEKWQETNEKLTLKIQNQLIAFDRDLAEDPELLEELTEEIKTGVVGLALTENEAEIEKKLKPVLGEVLTKKGYLINNEKQEEFVRELREVSQEEIQEIKKTIDSPIPQEVLNLYAQNNENVAFLPAYVFANPSLAFAYTQKALVALPVKFLQQSADETSPQWQKMLKEGIFVENYDLTIKNLVASGLSENHPTIIKLQRERGRLYDLQKTPEGKDKPIVSLLKTFFKPNELTGNQKGASETTGVALSGKTLWASGKGWAFSLKNGFNQIGLVSKIYQKFPSLPGKTLVTSKFSVGALAWSNRRLWRPAYLAITKTAAGKTVKVGIKKASAWVATKLGLQAAITAAGVGTGVGVAPAIAINLVIEVASLITDKLIKPFFRKIKENPLATIAIGVGVVVIIPSFAIIGITIAAIGIFTAMTGAGAILGGIAIGTLGFFTALVGGPVVGFSIVTAVIIGIVAISSLTFFIVMTTAGAFILPQGGSLNVAGPPIVMVAPNCTSTRHLAEDVVCQIQSCNIQYVTSSTLDATEKCLQQSNLASKETIISYFKASVASPRNDGKLQCVGFVQGVMTAMGHPLAGRDAKNYILETPPPSGYTSYNDPNQVQVGDLAVKTSGDFGHIMVIIAKDGDKLTVSQADGGSGLVGNGEIPASFVAKIGGFLRPN